MQWNDNAFAGFSSVTPWIKINEDYRIVNVEKQSGDPDSIWNAYHALIELRNNERALQYGNYTRLELNENKIWFSRQYERDEITVIINFGEETEINIPVEAEMLMGSNPLQPDHFIIYKTTGATRFAPMLRHA